MAALPVLSGPGHYLLGADLSHRCPGIDPLEHAYGSAPASPDDRAFIFSFDQSPAGLCVGIPKESQASDWEPSCQGFALSPRALGFDTYAGELVPLRA